MLMISPAAPTTIPSVLIMLTLATLVNLIAWSNISTLNSVFSYMIPNDTINFVLFSWESTVKQLNSARNIIYFTDKKEEDLHIEFNMYVWKLHILFHNVLAPKNNQVTEQVKGAKIRDKINNDSEWIFLQVSVSAIANPLQTIICRNHKLCDYGPTNMSVVERYQEWKCPQLFFENIVKHRSLHF